LTFKDPIATSVITEGNGYSPMSTKDVKKQHIVHVPVALILAFNSRPLRVTGHLNLATLKVNHVKDNLLLTTSESNNILHDAVMQGYCL
jgi:hypothetical protein